MKSNRYTRLVLKRTEISGLSATTAATADHTLLPAWSTTDIYPGEFFINLEDERIWIRTNHGIREIPMGGFADIQDKDALVYDISKGFWTNAVLTTGSTSGTTFEGGGLDKMMMRSFSVENSDSSLQSLSDVSISDLKDGQFLINNKGIWNNTDVDIKSSITDLNDVYIQDPINEQYLSFSNNKWTNKNFNQLSLSGLSNIKISNPTEDQVLSYSGGTWVNKKAITGLSWDKSTATLALESQGGYEMLTMEGKPIEIVSSDILLTNKKYTILVDATYNPVNVYIPSASECFGTIFNIKIVSDTFITNVIPDSVDDHIFTNLFSTGVTFAAFGSIGDKISIQSNGEDWYQI